MIQAHFVIGTHGNFTAAYCIIDGERFEVERAKNPAFKLCRLLDSEGHGESRIQFYTPEGVKSLRGPVKKMAGLQVIEADKQGLVRRKYRPVSFDTVD